MAINIKVPIVDYLKDPVIITSRDGTVVEVNDSLLKLIDASKDKVIGKDCREIEPLDTLCNMITDTALRKVKQKQRITYRNITLEASVSPVVVEDDLAHILIVLTDVSAFVNLEAEFLRKNRELIITNTLSSAFISSENIDSVFSDLMEKALLISHLGIGWIMLRQKGGYALKGSTGLSSDLRKKIEEGSLHSLIEKALSSGAPLQVLESEETAAIPELKDEGVTFLALIPLRVGDEVLGCLALANRLETAFDFDMASLLSLIGNNLSMIADKIKLFQKTQRLAITDGLTGLYNVRHFYAELDKEIARARRYSTPFSLALFDIDDFKRINDTFGHQAGDEVLCDVSAKILHVSRESDIVARYGGEEFICVLPNTAKEEAYNHACRVKEAVEKKRYLGPNSVGLTVSGGVASFPEDAEDAKALMYAADMAMYKAKASGKKAIQCYKRKP
jgi:diguanylate cyclase (GGDEF)-like protein/PAS domain S-box-containing protein